MNHNAPFSFHCHFDSLTLEHPTSTGQSDSRKRKSSYEDISPLVMKTRSGIGLEQEIVYGNISTYIWAKNRSELRLSYSNIISTDRTMTLMMQGQRRLLEEQKQREQQEQLLLQQQQQQQQQFHVQAQKESSAEAMRRLFMFSKGQFTASSSLQPPSQPTSDPDASQIAPILPVNVLPTFSDCAGEINGCETNRIPGMRDRYQAVIEPCSRCQRPQCQFCAVNCSSCQAFSCRTCCTPR
jgi:hypothetical protein